MATATLTLDKASYAKGDKITATYAVAGADATTTVITGSVTVDGAKVQPATVSITVGHVITFAAPTAAGVTFSATADPKVWTATA